MQMTMVNNKVITKYNKITEILEKVFIISSIYVNLSASEHLFQVKAKNLSSHADTTLF